MSPRQPPASRGNGGGRGRRDGRRSEGDRRGRKPQNDRGGDERRRRKPEKDRGRDEQRQQDKQRDKGDDLPKSWGGVARRGAGQVRRPDRDDRRPDGDDRRPDREQRRRGGPERSASDAWRDAARRATRRGRSDRVPPESEREEWQPEEWIDRGPVEPDETARDRTRSQRPRPSPRRQPRSGGDGDGRRARGGKERKAAPATPPDVESELNRAVGPRRAQRLQTRLMEAAQAFQRDRYQDARRLLKPVADEAPDIAAVRELHGLTLYRLARWRDAARELEAFRSLTGSVEQHPVLADCYRALRRWSDVEELWAELRAASPSAELVTEGRIVAAGAVADRGDIRDAISVLEAGPVNPKRPRWHHLRLWYALADLYERAGDVPRARELFTRIEQHEPGFADVRERLSALG